jgi:hypothetical protein
MVGLRNSSCRFPNGGEVGRMSKLLSLAVLLLIVWVILRVALAVTGFALHLLWIVAVILAVLWLVGKIRGGNR